MEGRGSDVEYWRGETHLGSSLPMSTRCFPCPCVVSRVHMSFPVSARQCLRPRIGACIPASLPASPRRCLCPCIVAHVRTLLPVSMCRCPRPFTFVGVGGSLCWWVVVFVCGQRQCGGGEPLVVGGESSGLALTCASVAVVVALWCQAVHVVVVTSGACRGCHVIIWLPRRQLQRGTFGCCQ